MTVLILGANGQVGRELTRAAWPAGLTPLALDRSAADLTNRDDLCRAMRAYAPKVVVNAAAYTAVDKAESDAAMAYAVNRDGPGFLADACAAANVPLVHISTDYVFDGTKTGPYAETDAVAPLGIYGASKEAGEQAVRAAWDRHVILRTAWVYSAFGNNFVKTMLRLARERDLLRVVDDQYGCPTAAGDIARAIAIICGRLASGDTVHGTFHFCGGGATTWCRFARAIFEIAAAHGHPVPRVEAIGTADYPTPARRPANSVLDCSRIAAAYGIVPRPWRQALEDVMAELLAPAA